MTILSSDKIFLLYTEYIFFYTNIKKRITTLFSLLHTLLTNKEDVFKKEEKIMIFIIFVQRYITNIIETDENIVILY